MAAWEVMSPRGLNGRGTAGEIRRLWEEATAPQAPTYTDGPPVGMLPSEQQGVLVDSARPDPWSRRPPALLASMHVGYSTALPMSAFGGRVSEPEQTEKGQQPVTTPTDVGAKQPMSTSPSFGGFMAGLGTNHPTSTSPSFGGFMAGLGTKQPTAVSPSSGAKKPTDTEYPTYGAPVWMDQAVSSQTNPAPAQDTSRGDGTYGGTWSSDYPGVHEMQRRDMAAVNPNSRPFLCAIRPVVPAPMTDVYRRLDVRPDGRKGKYIPHVHGVDISTDMPSTDIRCAGFALVRISHVLDRRRQLELALSTEAPSDMRWCYVRINGWTLQVWDQDVAWEQSRREGAWTASPEAWIDLRTVDHVFMEDLQSLRNNALIFNDATCRYEVNLAQRASGSFFFRVQEREEAEDWVAAIQMAIDDLRNPPEQSDDPDADWSAGVLAGIQATPRAMTSRDYGPPPELNVESAGGPVDPARAEKIKRVWWSCLLNVNSSSDPVTDEALEDLFLIFTGDGVGEVPTRGLSRHDIEDMLRELNMMRKRELEIALQTEGIALNKTGVSVLNQQGHNIFRCHREMIDQARWLLSCYRRALEPVQFRRRVDSICEECRSAENDGIIRLGRFTAAKPTMLMPKKEIIAEARFYGKKKTKLPNGRDDIFCTQQ
eukprot:gnl/TRDRNA2_/TRDRNA2_154203_c0_seq2.p1 gnl/TRDRNA2_/TRDRNA2_154203_c0~~gnl/TRDRNA2_/TRDRNA2_154203_c0_seq2.p1  ORF type:complete len:673 (+),score=91.27 gnl/TRDRNA2_/TRDRNA2_154203_c0_seq2:62-2020(+)